MKFLKSKDDKVTVLVSKVLNGTELTVIELGFGGKISVPQIGELPKDSSVIFKGLDLSEAIGWLKVVGFREVVGDN